MIHVVLGTKAQLVKMAPVMLRMGDRGVPYRFIHTGQHQATMDEMLAEFGLPEPHLLLHRGGDVVTPGQMLRWIARVLVRCTFSRKEIFGQSVDGVEGVDDIVLVHGDTFSTLLGALMGRIAGLRVGHVESGLRSFDLRDPFPEELTRLLVFRLCHELHCPGDWAISNVIHLPRTLLNTKVNTLSDALALALARERDRTHVPSEPFAVVSLHRYENIFRRERLAALVEHLESIAESTRLLFILHPPTESQLQRFALRARLEENPQIELRPRYTHGNFVSLLEAAEFVVTDGGSIQEESSYLGLPCLLLRRTTEREEGLGRNVVLSRLDRRSIERFCSNPGAYRVSRCLDEFVASDRIIDWISTEQP